jgi:uncharacterized protein YegJ (DUF2314 family)
MSKVIETPSQYQGQWIAWNENRTDVIAHGKTMGEVKKKAKLKAEHFWLDKIPSNKNYFNGITTIQ